MIYSRLFLSSRINKHIRFLGATAVVSCVLGIILFTNHFFYVHGLNTVGALKKAQIVNLSSTGAGFVWQVKGASSDAQWLEWGESMNIMSHKSQPGVGTDILYASIDGLEANKTYYVRVRSAAGTYTWEGNRAVKLTTPKTSRIYPQAPAYGKAVLSSGKAYANGIVFFEVDGYVSQATFTKETGEWLIPLNGFVDKKTNTTASVADRTKITIRIPSSPETTVNTTVEQIKPLSNTIVIGTSTYIAQGPQTEQVLGASVKQEKEDERQPSIVYPKEGALVPGNTPLIKGTAVANKEINVLIQGPKKQYSYRVVADKRGDWLVQHPLVLEAGNYVVSAVTQDLSGFKLSLKRTFTIIKSGEQVLGEATGSPTLAPTQPPPTSIPTPTSIIPSQVTVSTFITPTQFVPSPTPPRTGGEEVNGYIFAAVVCIVLGTGLVLVF